MIPEGGYCVFNEIQDSLRGELRDKEYAHEYARSFLNSYVATQIKVIREQRRMTQAQLGAAIGTTQGGISRIEDVNYSSWSIRTLLRIAEAFDVRLRVSFEPFGTLLDDVTEFNRADLETASRLDDPQLAQVAGYESPINIAVWKALNPQIEPNPPIPAGMTSENVDLGGFAGYAASSDKKGPRFDNDPIGRAQSRGEGATRGLRPTNSGALRLSYLSEGT
jgi:transcriptional regulator with XRE-family HTH domain